MTSNEKTRFTIRNRLADHFDEGFADDLMSLVPPFDISELATRAEMHAEFGSLRAEMAMENVEPMSTTKTIDCSLRPNQSTAIGSQQMLGND